MNVWSRAACLAILGLLCATNSSPGDDAASPDVISEEWLIFVGGTSEHPGWALAPFTPSSQMPQMINVSFPVWMAETEASLGGVCSIVCEGSGMTMISASNAPTVSLTLPPTNGYQMIDTALSYLEVVFKEKVTLDYLPRLSSLAGYETPTANGHFTVKVRKLLPEDGKRLNRLTAIVTERMKKAHMGDEATEEGLIEDDSSLASTTRKWQTLIAISTGKSDVRVNIHPSRGFFSVRFSKKYNLRDWAKVWGGMELGR